MKFIEFPQMNTVIANDQPQYLPIPALVVEDEITGERAENGQIVAMVQFENDEMEELIKNGGKLYFSLLTFGQPMQPVFMTPFEDQIFEAE